MEGQCVQRTLADSQRILPLGEGAPAASGSTPPLREKGSQWMVVVVVGEGRDVARCSRPPTAERGDRLIPWV